MGGGPVLAVFAHPDDAEIAAGGTLATWAAAGRAVHLLVLTAGERGAADLERSAAEVAAVRREEARAAAAILGAAGLEVLDEPDGELAPTPSVLARVVRRIRQLRPATVVSCDPSAWFLEDRYVNHRDHRAAGAIACDAVFPAAGNPRFVPEHAEEGIAPWEVPEVWLAWTARPNHQEDVTDRFQTKLRAVAAHESQVGSGLLGFFEDWIPREAEAAGARIGVRYAEAFRVLRLGGG